MKLISFVILSLIFSANSTLASSPSIPCTKFLVDTIYTLDQDTVPLGVEIKKISNENNIGKYFLSNSSNKPLLVKESSSTILKLQNNNAYIKNSSNLDFTQIQQINYFDSGSMRDLVSLDGVQRNVGPISNDNPVVPEPSNFLIRAELNGEPKEIRGQITYKLIPNDLFESECGSDPASENESKSGFKNFHNSGFNFFTYIWLYVSQIFN